SGTVPSSAARATMATVMRSVAPARNTRAARSPRAASGSKKARSVSTLATTAQAAPAQPARRMTRPSVRGNLRRDNWLGERMPELPARQKPSPSAPRSMRSGPREPRRPGERESAERETPGGGAARGGDASAFGLGTLEKEDARQARGGRPGQEPGDEQAQGPAHGIAAQ